MKLRLAILLSVATFLAACDRSECPPCDEPRCPCIETHASNPAPSQKMERIAVAKDGKGFVGAETQRPFTPWGLNYGNKGRLIEDFWMTEWTTVERDFQTMRAMGANVARVHLQFGKFMNNPTTPNPQALERLARLVRLSEATGVYLDLTGLACYRTADVPKWYDPLPEADRWAAQAKFWSAVAGVCADSSAIFCYDLINEPLALGDRKNPAGWYSGKPFGGLDFLQFVALDASGRSREEIITQWIGMLTRAIRERDARTMITVGLLPMIPKWGFFSGFHPAKVAPLVDYISIHIYPETKTPEDAMNTLRACVVGKPIVIEETAPLSCSVAELDDFLHKSRGIACGWVWHYNGETTEQLDALIKAKKNTPDQVVWFGMVDLFRKLGPEFVGK